MNAKHLTVTLALALAAGVAFAALQRGPTEAQPARPAADCAEPAAAAIPRVVVIGHRDAAQAAEAPIARIVVTARRAAPGA